MLLFPLQLEKAITLITAITFSFPDSFQKYSTSRAVKIQNFRESNETMYSRRDQVKFVEDSLLKNLK